MGDTLLLYWIYLKYYGLSRHQQQGTFSNKSCNLRVSKTESLRGSYEEKPAFSSFDVKQWTDIISGIYEDSDRRKAAKQNLLLTMK